MSFDHESAVEEVLLSQIIHEILVSLLHTQFYTY